MIKNYYAATYNTIKQQIKKYLTFNKKQIHSKNKNITMFYIYDLCLSNTSNK